MFEKNVRASCGQGLCVHASRCGSFGLPLIDCLALSRTSERCSNVQCQHGLPWAGLLRVLGTSQFCNTSSGCPAIPLLSGGTGGGVLSSSMFVRCLIIGHGCCMRGSSWEVGCFVQVGGWSFAFRWLRFLGGMRRFAIWCISCLRVSSVQPFMFIRSPLGSARSHFFGRCIGQSKPSLSNLSTGRNQSESECSSAQGQSTPIEHHRTVDWSHVGHSKPLWQLDPGYSKPYRRPAWRQLHPARAWGWKLQAWPGLPTASQLLRAPATSTQQRLPALQQKSQLERRQLHHQRMVPQWNHHQQLDLPSTSTMDLVTRPLPRQPR
jgi:hypothetical protein